MINSLKRTIFVESADTKITTKSNYFIFEKNEQIQEYYVGDIERVILSTSSCTLSVNVIIKCIENNIVLIFLDEKHNPKAQLLDLYGNNSQLEQVEKQFSWNFKKKSKLTNLIIQNKIHMQMKCLEHFGLKINFKIENKEDFTLIEGAFAKGYFTTLFGKDFARTEDNEINSKLNYGYSIIVSLINRIIVSHGYLTSIGINHHSKTNNFNLSYDFFEPFRPIIDLFVKQTENDEFNFEYKKKLINLLNNKVLLGKNKFELRDATEIYVNNCLNFLSKNSEYLEVNFTDE